MEKYIDITVKFIIPLLSIIITTYVVPWLKTQNFYKKVRIAVQAAEQIYKESGMGPEKYEYVASYIRSLFKIKKLSEEDIKRIIEAIVYEMNAAKK